MSQQSEYQPFTPEAKAIMKRNLAIGGRNRCMEEHGRWLGLDPSPMPMQPMPESAIDEDETE